MSESGRRPPLPHSALRHPVRNGSTNNSNLHQLHQEHHGIPPAIVKYRTGVTVLAFVQVVSGFAVLILEAICAVLAYAFAKSSMVEVGYSGLYVGVFAMAAGIAGFLSTRKLFPSRSRRILFILGSVISTLLALQAFAMSCAIAAILIYTTTSWESILEFVSRVSQSVDISLSLGTTTLSPTTPLPHHIQAEIAQDRLLVVGIRSSLFAIYFIIFATAVVSSCFSCCNYCRCWAHGLNTGVHAHLHHHPLHGQHNQQTHLATISRIANLAQENHAIPVRSVLRKEKPKAKEAAPSSSSREPTPQPKRKTASKERGEKKKIPLSLTPEKPVTPAPGSPGPLQV